MTQIRTLLIGTALTAFAATAAFAQTVQPAAGMNGQVQVQAQGADVAPAAPAAQGVQPVTPAPTRLTASGSTDPLVQKRDAKINQKADKQAANNEMKMNMQGQASDQDNGADVKH